MPQDDEPPAKKSSKSDLRPFGKELIPQNAFDGKDKSRFRDWAFRLRMYASSGTHYNASDAFTWVAKEKEEISHARLIAHARDTSWEGRTRSLSASSCTRSWS